MHLWDIPEAIYCRKHVYGQPLSHMFWCSCHSIAWQSSNYKSKRLCDTLRSSLLHIIVLLIPFSNIVNSNDKITILLSQVLVLILSSLKIDRLCVATVFVLFEKFVAAQHDGDVLYGCEEVLSCFVGNIVLSYNSFLLVLLLRFMIKFHSKR